MKRLWSLLLAAGLLLGLAGCGRPSWPVPECLPEEGQRLVVYTSHKEEVYRPIIREFEERTGIWVEVVTGGTNELLDQLEEEKDAPKADVMFGGGVESLASYRHCFSPYICGESGHILEQFQPEDACWTPFSALPLVLIYNTKLVSPEQLRGWGDLLSADFQGRIAFADPAVSGSSFTALMTLVQSSPQQPRQALSQFAKALEGSQLAGSADVLTAVADGTALVGITLEETARKRMEAGADIGLVYPCEGTSCVPDGSCLVRGGPHPDNAKKFLDFTASRDVQNLLEERFFRRTVRSDVSSGGILCPLGELKLVQYDLQWAVDHRQSILSDWDFFRKEAES